VFGWCGVCSSNQQQQPPAAASSQQQRAASRKPNGGSSQQQPEAAEHGFSHLLEMLSQRRGFLSRMGMGGWRPQHSQPRPSSHAIPRGPTVHESGRPQRATGTDPCSGSPPPRNHRATQYDSPGAASSPLREATETAADPRPVRVPAALHRTAAPRDQCPGRARASYARQPRTPASGSPVPREPARAGSRLESRLRPRARAGDTGAVGVRLVRAHSRRPVSLLRQVASL